MPERELLLDAIRTASDPIAVFDRVVQQCLTLIPLADGASLEVFQSTDTLEYVSAAGSLAPFTGLRIPMSNSFSGLTARSGSIQRCDDARFDPRVNAQAIATTGVVSMLCVPLSTGSDAPAVLKVSSRQAAAFVDGDVETLMTLAEFLSVTLRAATDIARVTQSLLAPSNDAHVVLDPDVSEASIRTARFVANVITPGLADQVDGARIINEVVESKDIAIHVQPIVDLNTGAVKSVEALARFNRAPHRGPAWWFALAERVGLGSSLELTAVEKALEAFTYLPAHISMAVNVSADVIMDDKFGELVSEAPMQRLTIEVTEHSRVGEYPRLIAALRELRQLGARISVDDAGSGYSGLSHIRQLVPDVLKLDRDLTIGVHADPVRQALAVALVEFARRIDADIIAEGIEVEPEAAMMRNLGVPLGQGYLFGRPRPPQVMFDAQI